MRAMMAMVGIRSYYQTGIYFSEIITRAHYMEFAYSMPHVNIRAIAATLQPSAGAVVPHSENG